MYNQSRWHAGRWIALGFLAVFTVFVATMIYVMLVVVPRTAPAAYYPMFPWGFGWFWGLIGFFLLFGLLRWALWGPRHWGYYRGWGYGPYGRGDEAYHILRERYARGEITKDQYDAMMRDLAPQAQTPSRP